MAQTVRLDAELCLAFQAQDVDFECRMRLRSDRFDEVHLDSPWCRRSHSRHGWHPHRVFLCLPNKARSRHVSADADRDGGDHSDGFSLFHHSWLVSRLAAEQLIRMLPPSTHTRTSLPSVPASPSTMFLYICRDLVISLFLFSLAVFIGWRFTFVSAGVSGQCGFVARWWSHRKPTHAELHSHSGVAVNDSKTGGAAALRKSIPGLSRSAECDAKRIG